ncbi:hypothetical protein Tco_1304904 [Tanacetum coccineum]
MDRGAANVPYLLVQYWFRHAEGRKSNARLSGGHFIRRLAHHFGLVSDDRLSGLSIVTRELPLFDMGELVKLNICREIGDDWDWVALRPERQYDAAAGALEATKDAPGVDEGRLEEEIQGLRRDVGSLRRLVERSMTDQDFQTMDHYTKKALWNLRIEENDEVEATDEEFSDNEMNWKSDGYCNGGKLPHLPVHYQDYEWYEALKDNELKEQALRNKAIKEGLISDDESNNDGWRRWESHEITYHDHDEIEYENEAHDERQELCETHELPVCNIRRFEMIKYSFGQDEEYVAVKEDEYDDLGRTNNDACRAYQEIFSMMDEGWMVTRSK